MGYQATPCGETQNRECKACTTCDGQTNFQSAKCTETKDTQCDACATCSSTEYAKSSCSAEKNTVCAAYGLTVKGGEAKGKVSKATTKRLKDTEIAFVRCVNDDVGISVCSDATSLHLLPASRRNLLPARRTEREPLEPVSQRTEMLRRLWLMPRSSASR